MCSWMVGAVRPIRFVLLALSMLTGFYPLVYGQSCPVQIDSVTRQALTSDMGVYGSVLRITYRNTSAFPIRGIEFGIEALDTERNNLRPNAIINYHPLASNAGQVLIGTPLDWTRRMARTTTL